jgi:hypothetical protein
MRVHMKKPELKNEIAALKKEVKHLKALLREAVGLLHKYKNFVVAQPEKPIPRSKRKATTKKKAAKASRAAT